jgi:UDP:flavonoid glycosyltransferase YjiC (YdhE family)
MRVLFAPQAGALGIGGITRCLAIAHHAAVRGHAVAFCAPEGYPLLDLHFQGACFDVPRPIPPRPIGAGEAQSFAESLLLRGMAEPDYLTAAVAAERCAIRQFRADAVVTENQPTVAIAARAEGIPFVATAATINLRAFAASALAAPGVEATVSDAYRLACRALDVPEPESVEDLLHGQAALNVAPTAEVLEPLLNTLPRLHYVGPLLFAPVELAPAPTFTPNDAEVRILVYLSAGAVTVEALLPVLAEALPPPRYAILVAARDEVVGERRLPYCDGNITVARLPGMSRAMQQTDLVVTRGGQNALMACLLAGRPVVGVPGTSSEPNFNLRVLEAHGVAAVLDGVPSVHALAEAATRLLDGATAERSAALGRILRRQGGPAEVVRLLESLVS